MSNYEAYSRNDLYVPLPQFFSVGTIHSAFDASGHFGTPDGVVAFASGGHEWLGLDYRNGSNPSVVFQVDDEPLVEIAATFDEFLEGLVEE